MIPSKTGNYSRIIEVNLPVRFYWYIDEQGQEQYDGLEFGPIPDNMSDKEHAMLVVLLGELGEYD